MKIDVSINDGSPAGVVYPDIYGENGRVGVGGAELALLTLCEGLANSGHALRVYNSPTHVGVSPFPQYPIDTFIPSEERDVAIAFRSPNHRIVNATGKKVWWSCDQFTVGDFKDFSTKVDKIVTISPFHANYFDTKYGIKETTIIDLPVRLQDYAQPTEKIKHRMIFCSVPDRGLQVLAQVYPAIKRSVPDASLVITSDYRLWGTVEPRNEHHIRRFLGMDGVKFLGAVPRREMVQEQLKAEIQAFPCTYDELFCYAVAECQVAGAYPVTSTQGALATTNMATQVAGDASNPHWVKQYAEAVIEKLLDPHLLDLQKEVQEKAIKRFSLARILGEWESVLE
jgi:glycosyltransferase involved in cell wall biosynthesis